ncbi:UDP-N-acetylenolpyruvoylglucosamine reductase [Candidatus Gottesmanbacteria bacterium RBG_16_52_11]|uniref:UDP-N-acetylenolpyruvoylglucosamine reductase n=1 Tax=Candidatus Gottesmanbacteria bacterium RBG_16_52_11 TaxID=1798374 RepID=A0A1F5YU99_9BACT|nr:MAG: UDP-N-acetylenolpyruvoylglucosamine reductase [Candidatus Gottesmanbacteria bacterium RBG_16_52_11]
MNNISGHYEILQAALEGRVKKDVPLARFTTYKVGGPAEYFFVAQTRQDLVTAVKTALVSGISCTVLGGGSNVLISDGGLPGLVIRNAARNISLKGIKGSQTPGRKVRHVFVEADAGVPMNQLVRFTIDQGLSGLEMHLGLPGTVGGAVYMNSKWTHPVGYVGDAVYQAEILQPSGDIEAVPRSYFRFAYDYSILQDKPATVVSVVFALEQQDKDALWQKANESIAYRRSSQPYGVATAGCVFRNIAESEAIIHQTPGRAVSAGFLADHAGCKGLRVGGAVVSDHHANFIINTGNATARDVVELIETVRSRVKSAFGVSLREEIVRMGKF